jgi:hypothetical protein
LAKTLKDILHFFIDRHFYQILQAPMTVPTSSSTTSTSIDPLTSEFINWGKAKEDAITAALNTPIRKLRRNGNKPNYKDSCEDADKSGDEDYDILEDNEDDEEDSEDGKEEDVDEDGKDDEDDVVIPTPSTPLKRKREKKSKVPQEGKVLNPKTGRYIKANTPYARRNGLSTMSTSTATSAEDIDKDFDAELNAEFDAEFDAEFNDVFGKDGFGKDGFEEEETPKKKTRKPRMKWTDKPRDDDFIITNTTKKNKEDVVAQLTAVMCASDLPNNVKEKVLMGFDTILFNIQRTDEKWRYTSMVVMKVLKIISVLHKIPIQDLVRTCGGTRIYDKCVMGCGKTKIGHFFCGNHTAEYITTPWETIIAKYMALPNEFDCFGNIEILVNAAADAAAANASTSK